MGESVMKRCKKNLSRKNWSGGTPNLASHSLGVCFDLEVEQTKLFVATNLDLYDETKKAVLKYRKDISDYIRFDPYFLTSLDPIQVSLTAPSIVQEMALASQRAGVGPMASVAGAIAEKVGVELLNHCSEVIVENGGDIYLSSFHPVKVALYAGKSPLSLQLALEIEPDQMPLGICTSAGTVGPSLSLGNADAVCVVSRSAIIADAYATAIGNMIRSVQDIDKGIEMARRNCHDIIGLVIVFREYLAMWGGITMVPI